MADTGWTRPTLSELVTQTSDDMIASLGGAAPYVPRSLLWVTSRVIAGTAHVLYGALTYTARQTFVSTADESGVLLHADELGVTQTPASKATDGAFTFTGTPTTAIDLGTEVVRSDGLVFVTAAGVVGGGGSVALDAEAEFAGSNYNCTVGDGFTYQLASPITGIDTVVTLSTDFANGNDLEDIEDLRARILYQKQHPPQGGAEYDYVVWANEYEPVQQAWVIPNYLGAGSLGVFFAVEGVGSAIIPTSGDVAAVQALIERLNAAGYSTRRPVNADVYVVAPTPVVEDFTITISPDTVENQAVVEDALNRLFLRRAGEQPTMSDYWLAIGEADLDDYTITSPTTPSTVTTTECAVLGTVTYA